MSWLKLRIKQRGMRIAHLLNLAFMIFVVFYYCMDLNIEKQTVFFNARLLLICTPYILLYLLFEC